LTIHTHPAVSIKPSTSISKTDVFIVHGHDEEAKVSTARFIERLGFKPIILHEQASSGKTIIEKIEEYSNVGFGLFYILLVT
jgi:predicted nucleotide-binding protein